MLKPVCQYEGGGVSRNPWNKHMDLRSAHRYLSWSWMQLNTGLKTTLSETGEPVPSVKAQPYQSKIPNTYLTL